jgi:hypothetical protein
VHPCARADNCARAGLQPLEPFLVKAVQLYEMILVGPIITHLATPHELRPVGKDKRTTGHTSQSLLAILPCLHHPALPA